MKKPIKNPDDAQDEEAQVPKPPRARFRPVVRRKMVKPAENKAVLQQDEETK